MVARVVAVVGATGLQGSAVVCGLLQDGTFAPRAISRNPESDASKALKAKGVEVVQADASDKATLLAAFAGCEAVFAMTLTASGVDEVAQGKNMIDAAKEVGVAFFLWTGLPSMKKLSDGKYTQCIQYDQKAEIADYLHASGLPNTTLHLGMFLDVLQPEHKMIRPNPTTGALELFFLVLGPDDVEAFTWIKHDLPAAALALFRGYTDPAKLALVDNQAFPLLTARMSMGALAGKVGAALGRDVAYRYREGKLGVPELDEMLLAHKGGFGTFRDVDVSDPTLLELGVQFGTLEAFLEEEIKPLFV
ncbi:NmrA domain-containing protein [Mycena chlorophos]|uniref:NmrA domain-containing protein n=1 Tax=Mycena chlorophos TaxID=658473 RepID=A0A8H6WAG1_MYCCL|nr:NmrA domain-containing protein [Mycena chlorophos]